MWYYVDANRQRVGPVDDQQFERLVRDGVILATSLVWQEGMAQWESLSQLRARSAAPAPAPLASVAAGAAEAGQAPGGAVVSAEPGSYHACGQCQRYFTADDLIPYQGQFVCAQCKETFFQRMREGLPMGPVSNLRFAGFWIRFVAIFIDGLILYVADTLLGFMFGIYPFFMRQSSVMRGSPETAIAMSFVLIALTYGVRCAYETFFVGSLGGTPGKLALGLRVVLPDGGKIGFGRAFGRYWAKLLSGLILCIGFILAAFDKEKRALHDTICNTRVIYK